MLSHFYFTYILLMCVYVCVCSTPGRQTSSIRSTGMNAGKSFSLWTPRHRYTVDRRCFFSHMVVLWFIDFTIDSDYLNSPPLSTIYTVSLSFSSNILNWINLSPLVVNLPAFMPPGPLFAPLLSPVWYPEAGLLRHRARCEAIRGAFWPSNCGQLPWPDLQSSGLRKREGWRRPHQRMSSPYFQIIFSLYDSSVTPCYFVLYNVLPNFS